jgi:hypothetical protein
MGPKGALGSEVKQIKRGFEANLLFGCTTTPSTTTFTSPYEGREGVFNED